MHRAHNSMRVEYVSKSMQLLPLTGFADSAETQSSAVTVGLRALSTAATALLDCQMRKSGFVAGHRVAPQERRLRSAGVPAAASSTWRDSEVPYGLRRARTISNASHRAGTCGEDNMSSQQ
eukprot:5130864-Pleurochrysis_carterae.AAC.1